MEARVDLRSDTVTLPSAEMRQSMANARVGDDVYRDDPTVNELEARAAQLLGKEAGLFVTSGTQGNLVSLLSHTDRGHEVLVGDRSHIFTNEAGGACVLGSLFLYPLQTDANGRLSPEDIVTAIKPDDYHQPHTKLLCVENTHNATSGQPIDSSEMAEMADVAHDGGLKVHVDGARLFNAAVSLSESAASLVAKADSATFCLSKGLACPVGSVVVGDANFIDRARRWRKMLGAGMRQVGIVAAAGLYALDNMIDRLADDHANASKLAHGLSEIDGIAVDPMRVKTNIVYFDIPEGAGQEIAERLRGRGILVNAGDPVMRMVTHYGVEAEDIDYTLIAMSEILDDGLDSLSG